MDWTEIREASDAFVIERNELYDLPDSTPAERAPRAEKLAATWKREYELWNRVADATDDMLTCRMAQRCQRDATTQEMFWEQQAKFWTEAIDA